MSSYCVSRDLLFDGRVLQEYPSKMRMKPLQTVHPLHGELMSEKKPKVTDPFFTLSCEDAYQPKPTSAENVLTKYKSSKYNYKELPTVLIKYSFLLAGFLSLSSDHNSIRKS